MAFLCAPGRDISKVKKEIVDYLPTQAWYLHQSNDGRLFYKDIQNLAAKLHSTARQYNQQTCLKELRVYLEALFQPSVRDCYQRIEMLAAIDEVHLESDRTALLLVQPRNDTDSATKLPKEWVKFHTDQEFKNRVLYLTGSQETLTHVLEQSAQYKAINSILDRNGFDRCHHARPAAPAGQSEPRPDYAAPTFRDSGNLHHAGLSEHGAIAHHGLPHQLPEQPVRR
jgi:hypothetical protein